MTRSVPVATTLVLAAVLAGCTTPQALRDLPSPTRGVLVLSLSGLSTHTLADGNTPFLDELSGRALNYRWAVAPAASTLATLVALHTGLHPGESGIDHVLHRPNPQIERLAERFSRFGFSTAGFTEGGFASRAWGFDRGFDVFSDPASRAPDATARTLERSLEFLDALPAGSRFLLWVHSSALAPPWTDDEAFGEARRGRMDLSPEAAERLRVVYRSALRALDGRLRDYFKELERRGLVRETTIVVLGAHGEEILEHGRLGTDQLYPEVTRVPLLLLHPEVAARRVDRLVRTTDLLPTLSLLAGLPPSLGGVEGALPSPLRALLDPPTMVAWAQSFGAVLQRSVWRDSRVPIEGGGEGLYQLVETRVEEEKDGAWVRRRVAFDAELTVGEEAGGLPLRLVSFARERAVRVTVDGVSRDEIAVPRRWRTVILDLTPGRHRIELETDGCDVPAELDLGSDPRCLSFKVERPPLRRIELFDLRSDPGAEHDLSGERPELRAELEALLPTVPARPVAWPERLQRTPAIREYLSSLGYLDWGG